MHYYFKIEDKPQHGWVYANAGMETWTGNLPDCIEAMYDSFSEDMWSELDLPNFDLVDAYGFDGTLRGLDGREPGKPITWAELGKRATVILQELVDNGILGDAFTQVVDNLYPWASEAKEQAEAKAEQDRQRREDRRKTVEVLRSLADAIEAGSAEL